MIFERTGDGRWYLKNTTVDVDADKWLKMILEASDEDVDFPLPCA